MVILNIGFRVANHQTALTNHIATIHGENNDDDELVSFLNWILSSCQPYFRTPMMTKNSYPKPHHQNTHIHTRMRAHTHAHMHTCTHARAHTHTHTRARAHVHPPSPPPTKQRQQNTTTTTNNNNKRTQQAPNIKLTRCFTPSQPVWLYQNENNNDDNNNNNNNNNKTPKRWEQHPVARDSQGGWGWHEYSMDRGRAAGWKAGGQWKQNMTSAARDAGLASDVSPLSGDVRESPYI